MGYPNFSATVLLLTVILVLLPTETYAFGAGDIPDFAYLNDRAFRHGDIENILETLVKSAGGAAGATSLLGFAQSVLSTATGGSKFNKGDIKKVYFGNWLRDYSQAMDIAGLTKLSADTLVLIVSILGFMAFGLATEEFEVTAERLGVYLPVEHIDNPKGYAAKEGDARKFHQSLRPPVQDEELQIDQQTGMKNYMATENRGWDTSTAHIRRTLTKCIEAGRRARGQDGTDLWDAYRHMGSGLHTLEDLLAHSNWCEIALWKMGHKEVFCHVGDQVLINTPNGRAPPLVTGTFGGADFLHSLMGEATDKLSQASVTDLSNKIDQASQGNGGNISAIKNLLSKLPIGGGSDNLQQGEQIQAQAQGYKFNPDNIAPPEVQQQLLALLKWRDGVYRDVSSKVRMVPGLESLLDELSNSLNAYVYTVIAPYVTPMMAQATGVLNEGSKAVVDSEDQFEVFNNPHASDPSHSMLSKDHFGLILNEPAGKIAQVVVEHSVNLIVKAWSENGSPDQTINQILEAFHHPYYATGRSDIQRRMFDHMERWLGGLGRDEAQQTIQALTKESVRNGKNKRLGSEEQTQEEAGYGGHSHSHGSQLSSAPKPKPQTSSYGGQYGAAAAVAGVRRTEGDSGNAYDSGRKPQTSGYGQGNEYSSGNLGSSNTGYTQGRQGGYGSNQQTSSYSTSQQTSSYGTSQQTSGYGQQQSGYGSARKNDDDDDDRRKKSHVKRDDDDSAYGSGRQTSGGYGGQKHETESSGYGGVKQGQGYGSTGYGGDTYGSGRGGSDSYGSGGRGGSDSYGSGGRGGDSYGSGGRGGDSYGSSRGGSDSYGSAGRGGGDHGTSGRGGSDTYGSGGRGGGDSYSSGGRGGGSYGSSVPSSEDSYGSGGRGASDSYGSSNAGREGAYGSHKRDESPGEKKSHRKRDSDSGSEKGRRYGKQDSDDERKSGHRQKSSERQGKSGYTPAYGGGQQQQYGGASGYTPSYGGRQSDDTYGAERMKIKDDDDSDDGHGKKSKHGGRGGNQAGYGGNQGGYGGRY